jgi:hypothetical protein
MTLTFKCSCGSFERLWQRSLHQLEDNVWGIAAATGRALNDAGIALADNAAAPD